MTASKRFFMGILLILVVSIVLFFNVSAEKTTNPPPTPTEPEEIFILEDTLWESAEIYKYVYSSEYEVMGVCFTELPLGTVIYAPFDGYGFFLYYEGEEDMTDAITEVVLASHRKNWDEKPENIGSDEQIIILSLESQLLLAKPSPANKEYNFTVKKGQPMLEVNGNGKIHEEVRLFIEAYPKEPDPTITNPKEYIREALKAPLK